jgi:hypothetical protein
MNGIFANYLRTMYWSVFGLKEWVRINILNYVIFPAKIQISKPIDVPYIHVYVWFKDDKHVVWMWIWLILKIISLLDRQTSYSGSTGWYFRYQSIHIQITYTYTGHWIDITLSHIIACEGVEFNRNNMLCFVFNWTWKRLEIFSTILYRFKVYHSPM